MIWYAGDTQNLHRRFSSGWSLNGGYNFHSAYKIVVISYNLWIIKFIVYKL